MTPEQIEQYYIKAYRTLYLNRGLDLFKMAYKGFHSGFLSPTVILTSGKNGLDFVFKKKKFYEAIESF